MKGYPYRFYVNGLKKGQVKNSTPKEQAKKWYAHALVPALRLRTREPDWLSLMCFPDFPVYRELYADTAVSLRVAAINVWVVSQDGGLSNSVKPRCGERPSNETSLRLGLTW